MNKVYSDNDKAIDMLRNITEILHGIEYGDENYIKTNLKELKNNLSKFEEIFLEYKYAGYYNNIVYKSKTIEELNLSVRSYNCLKRAELNTVLELINIPIDEIRKIEGINIKSLNEILNITEIELKKLNNLPEVFVKEILSAKNEEPEPESFEFIEGEKLK